MPNSLTCLYVEIGAVPFKEHNPEEAGIDIMGMFDYPRKKVKLMKILSKKAGRKKEAYPH
jgi:hypothetical protein